MTELYIWVKNFLERTTEVPNYSHLLFNGGKLYIPRDKEYEFLCKYSQEVIKGTKLYYVEQRPKTYKFMVDLDITDDHYWTIDEIAKIASLIQETIVDFFEKQVTICCTSSQKTKKDKIHTGVHLIWPNIIVTSETAVLVRSGIIQKLKKSDIKLCKSWEDVVDETIYTRVGYRMVESDKMSNGIPDNRPLKLLFVMNSSGEMNTVYYDRLVNDVKSLVLETSIRYVPDTYLNVGIPFKYPRWLEHDEVERAVKKTGLGTIASSKDHVVIEQFIRKNLPKEYSRGIVKAVTRYPDNNLLIKTNSKYCMNIGRCHNSCGVYFFASVHGLYVKCLCTCDKLDGRKHGYCKDYTSKCFKFDDDIKDVLFPERNKNEFLEKKRENGYNPKKTPIYCQEKVCDKIFDSM